MGGVTGVFAQHSGASKERAVMCGRMTARQRAGGTASNVRTAGRASRSGPTSLAAPRPFAPVSATGPTYIQAELSLGGCVEAVAQSPRTEAQRRFSGPQRRRRHSVG